MNQEASLENYLAIFSAQNPHHIAMIAAVTEREFIQAAEGCLEVAFQRIEEGAKVYQNLCERGLSKLLTDLIASSGLRASAEAYYNGHVDVSITCPYGRGWVYLGETKIYDGYQYHLAGCGQILGYCTGRQNRVFTVDFFKKQDMYSKLAGMQTKFDTNFPLEQSITSTSHSFKGSFVTVHRHKSGADVEILHYGVNVYCS